LAVHDHFQFRAREFDADRVPLFRAVYLFRWRYGPVDAAGEFAVFGLRIVAEVGHLHFETVEGRVALERCTQGAARVSRRAELELILEDKVAIFLLADQPATARSEAGEYAVGDFPLGRIF